MFTRKKSFYQRKLFYVALAAVLAFGIWVNQATDQASDDKNIGTNIDYPVDDNVGTDTNKNAHSGSQNDGTAYAADDPKTSVDEITEGAIDNETGGVGDADESEGYYLVKEDEGVIKIYYYDALSGERLLQDTNISFSLISEPDQEMFTKGIVLNTEEELLNLLQDFES